MPNTNYANLYIIDIISEAMMKRSTNIARDHLCSLGVCFGKFSKTGKFRLQITALEYIAQYALVCVFVFLQIDKFNQHNK
jgi:ribosome biogenesis protein Nip4